MSDRKYYVLCADNCKFESMTKEQILAAIEQAVSTGEIKNVDTGFVTKIKDQNRGNELYFWFGTTAEYNALETKLYNCVYFKTDDTTVEDINQSIKEHGETLKGHEAALTTHFNILNEHDNILTEQVDYIVEQDTSPFTCSDGSGNEATGHWYYRKWKSGIAECWFNEIIMFNAENIGNTGIADVDGEDLVVIHKNFTLPITFAKDISATCSCGWQYTEWAQCHAGSTSTVMVRIFCRAKSLEHLISKGLSISLQIKGNTK